MKGNYYYFAPLLDEKGEQVVRRPKAYEYFVYNEFVGTSYGLGNTEYPILTLKKFDHDPFEVVRNVYRLLKNEIRYGNPEKSYNRMWLLWEAISETVKELEGK